MDLSEIVSDVSMNEKRRQDAYDFSRKIQSVLVRTQDAIWDSSADEKGLLSSLEVLMSDSRMQNQGRLMREANLSMRMEDYLRLKAFHHFLETCRLLPPPLEATDEEYLAGACMGLAADLARYGLGRATVRDSSSVEAAAQLVSDIMDFLLELDFRNGPLRRKYDGTKWSLRALETLLYELTITSTEQGGETENYPNPKKRKEESPLLPNEALLGIKVRMEHRDELREKLIKMCRDGQKAAKQAIFALHRGDVDKANHLIAQCETLIQKNLFPIVEQEPNLRPGSFSSVLEEYAEAKLFATWLGTDSTRPTGHLLSVSGFCVELEPEEYIGGLCDLTGEVGRFAVQRGTVRDVESVQLSLRTNHVILSALQTMESWPAGTGKKLDPVRHSVEKLERMLYEMSLSEAAGGRKMKSDVAPMEEDDGMEQTGNT